jgi:succinate dehydrogenase/fumarate reductase flavoprotein subunit
MSDLNNRFGASRREFPERSEKSLHDHVEDGTFGFPAGTPPTTEIMAEQVKRAEELRTQYEALKSSFMQRVFNRNHVEHARKLAERAAEAAYGKQESSMER